jgi:hypothetical protein
MRQVKVEMQLGLVVLCLIFRPGHSLLVYLSYLPPKNETKGPFAPVSMSSCSYFVLCRKKNMSIPAKRKINPKPGRNHA